MAKFTITNSKQTIDCDPGKKIADIADENNTPLVFGCREAACGACVISVVEGMDNLSEADSSEKEVLDSLAFGPCERLGCQAKVMGDVTVEIRDDL